jgi:Rrf2 family transcriptional regulator, nitric oxide-sensitive transcriptional repressor
MKLTRYSDYAIRVLTYLASRPDRLCSIREIAHAYRISENHLMKVVHDLGRAGFVATTRGRGGGIRLARPASDISLGQVVRHTEDSFDLVDCGSCLIAPACGATGVLKEATRAFLAVLDRYTLAEVTHRRRDLAALFGASADLGVKDEAPPPS